MPRNTQSKTNRTHYNIFTLTNFGRTNFVLPRVCDFHEKYESKANLMEPEVVVITIMT